VKDLDLYLPGSDTDGHGDSSKRLTTSERKHKINYYKRLKQTKPDEIMIIFIRISVACEQAHNWEHTHKWQRANSKGRRSGREESGEEAQRN